MSRIFDALWQSQVDTGKAPAAEIPLPATTLIEPCGGPDLGHVHSFQIHAPATKHVVSLGDDGGLAAEKFGVLATRLSHLRREQKLKVLQLTSSVVGEGKTLVAVNLAITLARRGRNRVLLLEGDLRKPTISTLFGVTHLNGLGEWWDEGCKSILPYLHRAGDLSLWYLPAGHALSPADILQSGRLAQLLTDMTDWFDWIIIDSPPVLPMADANVWARLVDGTLLVVREGKTPRRALEKALESLDSPTLVGVVLNDAGESDRVHYYDQYYAAQRPKPNGNGRAVVATEDMKA